MQVETAREGGGALPLNCERDNRANNEKVESIHGDANQVTDQAVEWRLRARVMKLL